MNKKIIAYVVVLLLSIGAIVYFSIQEKKSEIEETKDEYQFPDDYHL
jgi:CHASE3 domain sensor protein